MDWFLYDNSLRHESININQKYKLHKNLFTINNFWNCYISANTSANIMDIRVRVLLSKLKEQ